MGISRKEALDCLRSNDLIGIGMEADAVRLRLHPEGVVSYAIEAAIDCATVMGGGTREGNHPAVGCAHRLFDAIRETIELGSTGVRLVSGVGCALKSSDMEWFEGLLRGVRQRFPSLWIETLSAAEILSLANGCGLGLRLDRKRRHTGTGQPQMLQHSRVDCGASRGAQAGNAHRCDAAIRRG